MNRYFNYIPKVLVSSGLLTLVLIFNGGTAHAEDPAIQTTTLVIPDPMPSDTSTVTIQSIQSKIDSATSTLSTVGQNDGSAIILAIQSNVPNTDTSTAISIATTQQPISDAVSNAQNKIQIAQSVIDSATAAVQIAQVSLNSVDSQTATVSMAQLSVDSATSTVASEILNVSSAQANVENSAASVNIDSQSVSNAASTKLAADLVVSSNTTQGLQVTVYSDPQYGARPPVGAGTIVNQGTVSNIDFQWGSGRVMGGPNDRVQVNFVGQFTPDQTGTMWLTPQADDGTILTIGGITINNWVDKGGGGGTLTLPVVAGVPQPFNLWYYENGGGAFVQLLYYTGSGWQVVPSSAFSQSRATQAQIDAASAAATALNNANATLSTDTSILNAATIALDAAQTSLNNAQDNLLISSATLSLEQQNLTNLQADASNALQIANSLSDSAILAVQDAVVAMDNSVSVTNNYYAEQKRIAAEQEAVRQAELAAKAQADALAAQQAAEAAMAAQIKAQEEAKAAAEAAAKALADQQAAEAAKAKAEADAIAAQKAADEKAAQDKADVEAKAAQDAANAKAEADKKAAEQAAADKAVADAKIAADKAAQDAANKAAEAAAKDQAAKDAQAKADAAKAAEDKAKQDAIGVKPNSPDQLSDTVVKEAPKEVLVAHIQVDKAGVENGGIEFFGTKSAPQVVGEDGKLTPAAPPPGSGLPIPADAITTTDTFIGQPGGTSFNAPDIAVPVILAPVDGALAVVPGIQAMNQAYVAVANIGNDMSPVTRKKAKKILVTTLVVGQIAGLRRRFGQ